MNTLARCDVSRVVPTNIAKARLRGIDRAATKIATANEKTMPTLENVLNIPEAIPNICEGDAFITAELFAGKKALAPMPLVIDATTTTHIPVVVPSWA